MYHRLRALHRWAGLLASLFLLVISSTGFLLATKGSLGWVRPPTQQGTPVEGIEELVSLAIAAEAAFALGLPGLQTVDDIDRMDYRPGDNILKVVSKRNYHEVQVDMATGKVVQVAKRVDQLAEDIHDLSYFADSLHAYVLPVVALFLFFLGATGIVIFFVPIARRHRYRRQSRAR